MIQAGIDLKVRTTTIVEALCVNRAERLTALRISVEARIPINPMTGKSMPDILELQMT